MDYIDLVYQYCPSEIQHSLLQIVQTTRENEQIRYSHPLTSTDLETRCAYATVGYLSQNISENLSDKFKITYLTVAMIHHEQLTQRLSRKDAETIRRELTHAIKRILSDIRKPHLQGMLLAVLNAYKIDFTSDISKLVDYRSLSLPRTLQNWMFNEYSLCMQEAGAADRVAKIFDQSASHDLRVIFTALRGKYARGNTCIPPETLKPLIRPYLRDNRPTQDVSGPGPAVSRYALNLMKVLK